MPSILHLGRDAGARFLLIHDVSYWARVPAELGFPLNHSVIGALLNAGDPSLKVKLRTQAMLVDAGSGYPLASTYSVLETEDLADLPPGDLSQSALYAEILRQGIGRLVGEVQSMLRDLKFYGPREVAPKTS